MEITTNRAIALWFTSNDELIEILSTCVIDLALGEIFFELSEPITSKTSNLFYEHLNRDSLKRLGVSAVFGLNPVEKKAFDFYLKDDLVSE